MNLQGDVIALIDENYNVIVKYTYDTWGQVLCVTDSSGTFLKAQKSILLGGNDT